MNFTQLKYFEAVCSCGSVSRAAEMLHISQPSLSAAIRELETEFGTALFKRHHKGVSPTPAGEMFLAMSKDILSRVAETAGIMQDLGSGRKVLKLGLPPMIGSMFLTRIYQDFRRQYPDVTIEISEGGYRDLKQKLRDGFLDVTFMSYDKTLDPELSSVFLSDLEVVCCVHKEDPIAQKTCVKLREFADKPVVLFEDGFFHTAKIKERFRLENVDPPILLQTSQLSTLLNVISHKMAAGFLFAPVSDNYPDVVAVPLEDRLCIKVGLVYKENAYPLQCVKDFIAFMKQHNTIAQTTIK